MYTNRVFRTVKVSCLSRYPFQGVLNKGLPSSLIYSVLHSCASYIQMYTHVVDCWTTLCDLVGGVTLHWLGWASFISRLLLITNFH